MKVHTIERVEFAGDTMILHVDARRVEVDLRKTSARLAAASPAQRMRYEVSPSGYGIRWPELDEDLSVDGILGVRHTPKAKFIESVAEDAPEPD